MSLKHLNLRRGLISDLEKPSILTGPSHGIVCIHKSHSNRLFHRSTDLSFQPLAGIAQEILHE